jgi:hypothetical protein
MAPNEDVERPRASSAAERQKSIVSMTEFEGMDEYTALQKYILFYRDNKTNPHEHSTPKKKAWWQFWKSGSATAVGPVVDEGAVPDDCTYIPLISVPQLQQRIASHQREPAFARHRHLRRASPLLSSSSLLMACAGWPELKLLPASDAMAADAVGLTHQTTHHAACEMSITMRAFG